MRTYPFTCGAAGVDDSENYFILNSNSSSSAAAAAASKPILADRYKTKMCRNFVETGFCPYAARCMFAHGKLELRTAEMNLADGLVSEDAIRSFRRSFRLFYSQQQQQQQQQQIPEEGEEEDMMSYEYYYPSHVSMPSAAPQQIQKQKGRRRHGNYEMVSDNAFPTSYTHNPYKANVLGSSRLYSVLLAENTKEYEKAGDHESGEEDENQNNYYYYHHHHNNNNNNNMYDEDYDNVMENATHEEIINGPKIENGISTTHVVMAEPHHSYYHHYSYNNDDNNNNNNNNKIAAARGSSCSSIGSDVSDLAEK